jgi:hypothetical protein
VPCWFLIEIQYVTLAKDINSAVGVPGEDANTFSVAPKGENSEVSRQ